MGSRRTTCRDCNKDVGTHKRRCDKHKEEKQAEMANLFTEGDGVIHFPYITEIERGEIVKLTSATQDKSRWEIELQGGSTKIVSHENIVHIEEFRDQVEKYNIMGSAD
jgi:hypothetical protein